MGDTKPMSTHVEQTAPHTVVMAAYTAPDGSVYVHQDLSKVVSAWDVEAHVPPIRTTEKLGDVESWCAYVTRFAGSEPYLPLLTWNERGLRAVLDYHTSDSDPGRCEWIAEHPFVKSHQWLAWAQLANGQARSQRQALEALEDLAEDIKEPDAASLMEILRRLRASVSASADTELRPDGSTRVEFKKDSKVQAGEISLPPEFAIQIPVLKGHTEERDDRTVPVMYRLGVRVRVSVDDQAHLTLRFSMPGAERVLEAVYADRVDAAKTLLGDTFSLLRSAGN